MPAANAKRYSVPLVDEDTPAAGMYGLSETGLPGTSSSVLNTGGDQERHAF